MAKLAGRSLRRCWPPTVDGWSESDPRRFLSACKWKKSTTSFFNAHISFTDILLELHFLPVLFLNDAVYLASFILTTINAMTPGLSPISIVATLSPFTLLLLPPWKLIVVSEVTAGTASRTWTSYSVMDPASSAKSEGGRGASPVYHMPEWKKSNVDIKGNCYSPPGRNSDRSRTFPAWMLVKLADKS